MYHQFYPERTGAERLTNGEERQFAFVKDGFPATAKGEPVFEFRDREQALLFEVRWDNMKKEIGEHRLTTDLQTKLDPTDTTMDRFLKSFNHDEKDYGPGREGERLTALREGLGYKDSATPNRIQDKFIMENAPATIRYEYAIKGDKELGLKYIEAALRRPDLHKWERALSPDHIEQVKKYPSPHGQDALQNQDYRTCRDFTHTNEKTDNNHYAMEQRLEVYRGKWIMQVKDPTHPGDDTITVRDPQEHPKTGQIIALDDSKIGGNRREIPGANNVETARNYIDSVHISKHYSDHWKGTSDAERRENTKKAYSQFMRDTSSEFKENPEPYTEKQVISAVRLLDKYQDVDGKHYFQRAELDSILKEHGLPAADQILKTQSLGPTKEPSMKDQSAWEKNATFNGDFTSQKLVFAIREAELSGVSWADINAKLEKSGMPPAEVIVKAVTQADAFFHEKKAEIKAGMDEMPYPRSHYMQNLDKAIRDEKIAQGIEDTKAPNNRKKEATVAEPKAKYEVFVDPKTEKVFGDSHFKIGSLKENLPPADYQKMAETHTQFTFAKANDAKVFVAEQTEKAVAKGHTPTPPDPERPLTDKQRETIEKHGTKEAKEALQGGHNALARKHLDSMMKEWETKRNAPLTDKQKEIVQKYGNEQAREALTKGDNATSRDALNGILKDWEEKKKVPLTEKQMAAIEKHGTPEIKEAIKSGDNHAGRLFLREYAKELDSKPLTEKQVAFIKRFGDKETVEKVSGGNNHLGRDWLNKFEKDVTAEVTKYQNRNPEYKNPDMTAELKKAELTIRANGLENYRDVAYNKVAKDGLETKDIASYIKDKVQAPVEKGKTAEKER